MENSHHRNDMLGEILRQARVLGTQIARTDDLVTIITQTTDIILHLRARAIAEQDSIQYTHRSALRSSRRSTQYTQTGQSNHRMHLDPGVVKALMLDRIVRLVLREIAESVPKHTQPLQYASTCNTYDTYAWMPDWKSQ